MNAQATMTKTIREYRTDLTTAETELRTLYGDLHRAKQVMGACAVAGFQMIVITAADSVAREVSQGYGDVEVHLGWDCSDTVRDVRQVSKMLTEMADRMFYLGERQRAEDMNRISKLLSWEK